MPVTSLRKNVSSLEVLPVSLNRVRLIVLSCVLLLSLDELYFWQSHLLTDLFMIKRGNIVRHAIICTI
jgi:hypothetical protein